jgi:hypothetical protein
MQWYYCRLTLVIAVPVGHSTPSTVQWYAPIKIIGIKIIVPIKCEKSLRLMVHISNTLTKALR